MKKTFSKKITDAMLVALAANIRATDGEFHLGHDLGHNNASGAIYMANESRFVEANFSEPLTSYAVGWKDNTDIVETLNFLCPDVPVGRRFEFAKGTNSESFLSETDDIRAIGAAFKRVEFTSSKVNEKCYNKGLTVRVDLDNVNDQPMWKEQYTSRLIQRLYRNELRRAIALAVAAGTNTPKTWNGSAGQDPDAEMAAVLVAGTDDSGVELNRILIGANAWQKRFQTLRSANNPGGYTSSTLTPEQLAALLQVDKVLVSKQRYATSTTAKSQIVGNYVFAFSANDGMTPDDPSNLKRFVANTNDGQRFRVFEQQISSHLYDITVEHYSNIVVTSTLGIEKMTIS